MSSKLKMKQQEVVICSRVDELTGYGNLSRSITLAEALRKKGYKIIFVINHNASAAKELQRRKFPHILIPKSISYHNYHCLILDILNSKKCKIVVIDMRELGEQISKNLMNKNLKIILLDDAWCRKAYADIIFNGTMIKQYHKYEKINQKSKTYVGTKYWLIREEFFRHQKKIDEINDKKKYHVIISMGGSDPNESSLLVVKSLLNITNIQITVIIGPLFNNITKLRQLIKYCKNITILNSPKKIWKVFVKADIVISNAGNTLFELATQRIPTICIATVRHQLPYAKTFASRGFAINLGLWKKVNTMMIRKTLIEILQNKFERRKMCLAGSKIIDGKGLSRVMHILDKTFKGT